MIPARKTYLTFTRNPSRTVTNYRCCVRGCQNIQLETKISFFTLPKETARRMAWLKLIGRVDLMDKPDYYNYRVCSKHFPKTSVTEWYARILQPDAEPCRYLPIIPRAKVPNKGEIIFCDAGTQTSFPYKPEPVEVKIEPTTTYDFMRQPFFVTAERAVPNPFTSKPGSSAKRDHPTGNEENEAKKPRVYKKRGR